MIRAPQQVVTQPFFTAQLATLPPGINQSYKIGKFTKKDKTGNIRVYHKIIASDELNSFKEHIAWELHSARHFVDRQIVEAIKSAKKKRQHVPLAAHISFYFPTLWKKDVDGGEKHIIDAVFQHLELNDNLNVEIHVYKFADRDEPRVEVELCCVAGR